ncbi:MAG: hypothetical protein ACK56F_31890, partial [bacterium]
SCSSAPCLSSRAPIGLNQRQGAITGIPTARCKAVQNSEATPNTRGSSNCNSIAPGEIGPLPARSFSRSASAPPSRRYSNP